MNFFDPDTWRGKEVVFSNNPEVTWVLDQKLDEKSNQKTKEDSTAPNVPSAAVAVFSCHPKEGEDGTHAMKIWMQIPYRGTNFASAQMRKAQADSNHGSSLHKEIAALRRLTANISKNSPHLIDVLHTTQGDNGMVPTGHLTYILMTWCPGVPLQEDDCSSKSQSEQDAIRQAFKEAHNDAKRCRVLNRAPGPGDLIWDAEHSKIYMVDFKLWGPPHHLDILEEAYQEWGLW